MVQGCNLCRDLVSYNQRPGAQVPTANVDCSKMTDVYEGSLIRLFRRLEELLRQIAQGAKVMGNNDLEQKFEKALEAIRRDLVAAQSLYL